MTLLFLALPSSAATLTVGPSGTYGSLSDAIAAAADGDILVVAAGVYSEQLDFGGKSLSILGMNGRDQTLLVPPAYQDAVIANKGETALLSGFSILPTHGRGVVVENSSLSLAQSSIEQAEGDKGGAMAVLSGTLSLTSILVTEPTASYEIGRAHV